MWHHSICITIHHEFPKHNTTMLLLLLFFHIPWYALTKKVSSRTYHLNYNFQQSKSLAPKEQILLNSTVAAATRPFLSIPISLSFFLTICIEFDTTCLSHMNTPPQTTLLPYDFIIFSSKWTRMQSSSRQILACYWNNAFLNSCMESCTLPLLLLLYSMLFLSVWKQQWLDNVVQNWWKPRKSRWRFSHPTNGTLLSGAPLPAVWQNAGHVLTLYRCCIERLILKL